MANNSIDDFFSSIRRSISRAGASALGAAAKDLLKAFGVPIASLLLIGMDLWNYAFDKSKITGEYEKQIAAKLGIRPNSVTPKDMEEVAKDNPTLGEALQRSKKRRNLNIVIDVACTAGAFALAVYFAAPLAITLGLTTAIAAAAGTTAGAVICGAAISFVSYLAGKVTLNKIGKKVTRLEEPTIRQVEFAPNLQDKLSLPSQVHYIEHLQRRGVEILPSQIMEVFKKANPALPPDSLREQYDIGQITRDINEHLIDARELAFMVHGQQSGVPRLEVRPVSDIQRKVAEFGETAKGKALDVAGNVSEAVKNGSAVAKDKINSAASAVSDTVSKTWQDTIGRRKSLTPAEIAEQRLAQKNEQSTVSVV